MIWVLVIVFSFVSMVILIPSFTILGVKLGILDRPGERKIHGRAVPCTGGLGLLCTISLSCLFLIVYCGKDFGYSCLAPILGGILVIGVLGIYDDVRGANAKVKFLVQGAAAIIVMSSGITLDRVLIPYDGFVDTGMMGYVLTLVWIVGITNAYNLIDGMDGLACCIVGVVAGVISAIGFLNGNLLPATLAGVVSISSFAFYRYNRHPAGIFLGDTGSLLLGFLIAVTSLECLRTPNGSVAFFPMVVINGLVITDTTIVFVKRAFSGKSPFSGGLDHVHHRMLRYTGSIRSSLKILLAVNVFLAVCGFSLLYREGVEVAASMLTLTLGMGLFFSRRVREIVAVLLNLSGGTEESLHGEEEC